MAENVPIGQMIGTIFASDLDEADQIVFEIDENPHVEIDRNNGNIIIRKTFDFEEGFRFKHTKKTFLMITK